MKKLLFLFAIACYEHSILPVKNRLEKMRRDKITAALENLAIINTLRAQEETNKLLMNQLFLMLVQRKETRVRHKIEQEQLLQLKHLKEISNKEMHY